MVYIIFAKCKIIYVVNLYNLCFLLYLLLFMVKITTTKTILKNIKIKIRKANLPQTNFFPGQGKTHTQLLLKCTHIYTYIKIFTI